MIQFPHNDDDKLVSFLKQYRPLPPPAKAYLEDRLLESLRREPVSLPKQPSSILWLLTSTIAATLSLVFGSYYWFNTTPQVTTTSDEELEAFLIESWDGTVREPSPPPPVTSSESDWLILAEPQPTAYSYYHP